MTQPISRLVRQIVLVALAPASALGCGNSSASPSGSNTGSDSGNAATGCYSPAALANNCAGVSGRPNCMPSAYLDGGAGPCASHWIQGDGCCGGSVLFPCGLPSNMQQAFTCSNGSCVQPGTTANERFAPYCMGSDLFNGAYATDLDGGPRAWFQLAADGSFEEQPDSTAIVHCYYDCTGRRPARLVAGPLRDAATAGDALARAAFLEEASVAAFLDLAAELEGHRAPRKLLSALHRAAKDEMRHARGIGALARARGGRHPPVRLARRRPRSLVELALENVREGCVRETWGAACAVVQSMKATDLDVRRAMRTIARDELRHATLSRDLADWLDARLTRDERARVEEARCHALAELEAELQREPREAFHDELGLPTRDEAHAVLRGMRADVWMLAA